MKKYVYLFLLTISVVSFSCGWGECWSPGPAVYKTRGDYFDLARMWMDGNKIVAHFSATEKMVILENDTVFYPPRMRMSNGYVLDAGAALNDVYLSITWKEMYEMEQKYNTRSLPEDTLRKYILDKNPYIEYWGENKCELQIEDYARINELIEDGELHKYFKRIK